MLNQCYLYFWSWRANGLQPVLCSFSHKPIPLEFPWNTSDIESRKERRWTIEFSFTGTCHFTSFLFQEDCRCEDDTYPLVIRIDYEGKSLFPTCEKRSGDSLFGSCRQVSTPIDVQEEFYKWTYTMRVRARFNRHRPITHSMNPVPLTVVLFSTLEDPDRIKYEIKSFSLLDNNEN
jgi:hypothetical protein